MKKFLVTIFTSIFTFSAFAQKSAPEFKYEVYNRTGSSAVLERNIDKGDNNFGGMYSTFYGAVAHKDFSVVVKSKLKLSSAECWDDLSTSATWEKAWVSLTLPVFRPLKVYGGKGYVLAAPGTFFNMADVYADGSRWGNDGIGFTYSNEFVTCGASYYITSSANSIKDKLRIGTGANFDLVNFNLPVEVGVSLIYDNAKNTKTDTSYTYSLSGSASSSFLLNGTRYYYTKKTSTNYGKPFADSWDYTPSIFARYRPSKNITVTGGYALNASPVTASSTFKRVENYSLAQLNHSHVATLISRWKFEKVSIEEEAEFAKTFDGITDVKGNIFSVYGALRAKFPIYGILYGYPSVHYYGVHHSKYANYSRESLILSPKLTLEKGHHYFSFGVEFENREVDTDSYDWIMRIPLYYKFTIKN